MNGQRAVVGLVVGGALSLLAVGCSYTPPVTGRLQPAAHRSQKLMALAAEEAAQIPDTDVRLTRQLNLADMQIDYGWKNDARGTLSAATETLKSEDAKKLNEHARISGWVSVSQLARRADAAALGLRACDSAVEAMRKIEDPARRCDYVMGLANELQYLKGKAASASLLAEAGPWTRSIDNLERRRSALVAVASALFNFDDYVAGQKVLRQDDEPAWRSQMLLSLAALPAAGSAGPMAARDEGSGGMKMEPASAQPQRFYGKQLDFGAVFRNQSKSKTEGD